jgi:hypothetical protein
MLVSKIHTYLSHKMHLKKGNTKKYAKLGLTPKIARTIGARAGGTEAIGAGAVRARVTGST